MKFSNIVGGYENSINSDLSEFSHESFIYTEYDDINISIFSKNE